MAIIVINPDRAFMLGLKDGLAGRNAPNNRGFGLGELRNYAEGQRAAKERATVQRSDNTVVFDGAVILGTHAGVSQDTAPAAPCDTGGTSDGGCGGEESVLHLTNQLRWLVRKNTVTTEAVRAYRDANNASMQEAKAKLENSKQPVLQQWWEAEDGEACLGEWRNVPVVYEPSL